MNLTSFSLVFRFDHFRSVGRWHTFQFRNRKCQYIERIVFFFISLTNRRLVENLAIFLVERNREF